MCVQIMGKYQQARFESYRCFPMVTLIKALGHLSMSNLHTKCQISHFERFHTVQNNFYTSLDKNILRINA